MVGSSRVGRAVAAATATAALAVGLTSCSLTVDKDEVARTVQDKLKESLADVGPVTCPEDLPAEIGKSVVCTFDSGGLANEATATVSSVQGDTAYYDVVVKLLPVPKAELETKVTVVVEAQVGATESTTCQGDLQAEVGRTQTCSVTAGGSTLAVKTTVTSIENGNINFDVGRA